MTYLLSFILIQEQRFLQPKAYLFNISLYSISLSVKTEWYTVAITRKEGIFMQSIQYLKRHPYVLLTLCALVLFLAANNFLAITDSAESNYALTAKEMVLSGNWVSPQIYGHYWYDKPIFYYWELAASFAVFGFNEFAARFPAAIMGTLSVLFTYWFAARVYGRRLGMAAAIIYMTSLEGWLLSKAVITDATLFLFQSAVVAFFYLGYTENRRWYWLCYVFAALAVLTKGPIGLALPGLTALIFLALRHNLKELLHVHLLPGLLLFLVIGGSWYVAMYNMHGHDFLLNFFGVHNFLRATVPEHASKNVWYFYILVFFIGFAPWSFTWPYALWKYKKSHTPPFTRSDTCAVLLSVYALVVFVVFSLIATKYTTYTYPMLFSLSILTAGMFRHWHIHFKKAAWSAGIVYVLLAFFVAPPVMLHQSGKEIGQALDKMNTDNVIICYYRDYSTGAVFYSGKKIYQAVPADKLEDMKPGELDWNAKNVMPLIAIEDVLAQKDNVIIVDTKRDNEPITDYYLTHGLIPDQLTLPGDVAIWSILQNKDGGRA